MFIAWRIAMANLCTNVLPQKEKQIRQLKFEAATQKNRARASTKHLGALTVSMHGLENRNQTQTAQLHQGEQDKTSLQAALKLASDEAEITRYKLTDSTATIASLNTAWTDNRLLLIRNEALAALIADCKRIVRTFMSCGNIDAELLPCKLLFDDARRL